MQVRPLKSSDDAEWLRMRQKCWPRLAPGDHLREMNEFVRDGSLLGHHPAAVFVVGDGRALVGFAEVGLASARPDAEEPTALVLNWFVHEDRDGAAASLMEQVAIWARRHGARRLESECHVDDHHAVGFHREAGFDEIECVVRFEKNI